MVMRTVNLLSGIQSHWKLRFQINLFSKTCAQAAGQAQSRTGSDSPGQRAGVTERKRFCSGLLISPETQLVREVYVIGNAQRSSPPRSRRLPCVRPFLSQPS